MEFAAMKASHIDIGYVLTKFDRKIASLYRSKSDVNRVQILGRTGSLNMDVYNWSKVTEEKVTPLVTRQAIHTSRMTLLKLRLKKGAVLPMHQHPHEQITMMASGLVRVALDGDDVLLRSGDVLLIPSNATHLLEALEDSVGTDVFTPPREDLMPKPTAG